MGEASQLIVEQSPGILRRIDGLVSHARGTVAVIAASLAMGGVGTAVESIFDTATAAAQTTEAHTSKLYHPKLIQEYVSVDGGGSPVFLEKCMAGSRQVKRHATYRHPDQPLGKCNLGSSVTVIDTSSGVRKKVPHATRKNNHFVFAGEPDQTPSGAPPNQDGGGGGMGTGGSGSGGSGGTGNPYESGNVGVDISWPQCGTANETPSGFDFGIVGVNAGLWFSTNPCLQEEAANFPGGELNLYVNTEWNSNSAHVNTTSPEACAPGDELCAAYDTGYSAGVYAVQAAIAAGVPVNVRWFEDVEPDATWSNDTAQNIQSLQGMHDALMDNGAAGVGIYSWTVAYNDITGGWQNGWESWGFTTWDNPADAMTFCQGHEFTGGPSVLMQFTPTGSNLDHDVAC